MRRVRQSAGGIDLSVVAATVAVQKLSDTLIPILVGLPGILGLGYGLTAAVPVVVGIAVIVTILTVSPVFRVEHNLITHIPILNRLLPAIDELQKEAAELLHRQDALALSVLDAARFAVAATSSGCYCRPLGRDTRTGRPSFLRFL